MDGGGGVRVGARAAKGGGGEGEGGERAMALATRALGRSDGEGAGEAAKMVAWKGAAKRAGVGAGGGGDYVMRTAESGGVGGRRRQRTGVAAALRERDGSKSAVREDVAGSWPLILEGGVLLFDRPAPPLSTRSDTDAGGEEAHGFMRHPHDIMPNCQCAATCKRNETAAAHNSVLYVETVSEHAGNAMGLGNAGEHPPHPLPARDRAPHLRKRRRASSDATAMTPYQMRRRASWVSSL